MKFLLSPLSSIFRAASDARRKLYEKGIFKSHDLGVPVVSVGNLTVGGTGKTPLVALVAKELAQNGHRVCVLTRGYKRADPNQRVLVSDGKRILADAEKSGDEPFELANKLLRIAAVVADKKRVEAGVWARQNLGATAFVLDDGFQHLRLKRKLDIVTIDATNPFGNEKLLPAGILREPPESLKRAGLIVVTRADLNENIEDLKNKIRKYNPDSPLLLAKTKINGLKPLTEFLKFPTQNTNLQNVAPRNDQSALAFCALGNPAAFFADLNKENFNLKATKAFADHYAYTQADVEVIERKAKENGAKILLTTAKDAVKLNDLKFNTPCFVVEIELETDDQKTLSDLLKKGV